MAKQTEHGITWCEETWNPLVGCSRISKGCQECYAEILAHRFQSTPKYAGTTRPGGGWSGQINFDEKALLIPLKRKKPTVYFVNSMSDLFHEKVEDEWIDRIFGIMAGSSRHRFLILTKRPERMRDYCKNIPCAQERLPNVGLGVSVEDQSTADERIPLLLQAPAAMRFVSYEPALGPVDFVPWLFVPDLFGAPTDLIPRNRQTFDPSLSWIIAGGESGPGARAAHPDWFRSVRNQCQAAGVAFHLKQWGEYLHASQVADCPTDLDSDYLCHCHRYRWVTNSNDQSYRVGKKHAGRLLDGREWNERPEWFFDHAAEAGEKVQRPADSETLWSELPHDGEERFFGYDGEAVK